MAVAIGDQRVPGRVHYGSDQRLRASPIGRISGAILGGEFISPPIGQALALHTLQNDAGALAVAHGAGVVAKIELTAVAAKVSLAHVVIGADHATLEDAEEVSAVLLCVKPPVRTYWLAE